VSGRTGSLIKRNQYQKWERRYPENKRKVTKMGERAPEKTNKPNSINGGCAEKKAKTLITDG